MVSTRPVGLPSWTLPLRQHELIPTPVDILAIFLMGWTDGMGMFKMRRKMRTRRLQLQQSRLDLLCAPQVPDVFAAFHPPYDVLTWGGDFRLCGVEECWTMNAFFVPRRLAITSEIEHR